VDFRILGPLEVRNQGHELPIAGSKQRAVLAILLLHANEVVSSDRLIEELWGGEPPASAAKSLQVHISRLRRSLESGDATVPDGVIVTRGGGYVIRVGPNELDRERFERLVDEGARALAGGAPEHAAEMLREALGLWRGPPLADFAYESFAQPEIGRLQELRLTAVEKRIEADLACGRHAQTIGELESLIDRHPLREGLRAQLMLALYRSGRQAEALETYRDARRALVDELGIEPGEELRELERAILAHDPSLGGPVPPARPEHRDSARPQEPPEAAVTAPRPRRGRLVAAGVGIAVLVLAGLAVLLANDRGDSREVAPLTNDSHAVAVIDPATNEVTTTVSVGTNPGPLAFEPESRSLWVGNLDDESVTRIDSHPIRTGSTVAIGERPGGLAAGEGSVWVTGATRTRPFATVRRIDPRFDKAHQPIRIENLPDESGASIALGRGSLWVAPSVGLLTRLDPATGRVVGPRIDAGHSPSTVASDGRMVWVADRFAAVVTRIDPRTGVPQPIPVAGGPADIALGAGAAWVTLALDDSVTRIDRAAGVVRDTIPVGRRPGGVAVGAGGVWVANTGDGTVSRLDPRSGRVIDTIPVGASPQDLLVADGRVWVSVRPRRALDQADRGGAVQVETPIDVDFLDPALAYVPLSWQILYPTCAKLMNYPAEQGAAGAQLVPELAESSPTRSDGGRTYTFRIRKGFRFSPPSGEPVTAQTMKYSIERSAHPRMESPATGLVADLVGAGAYAAGRARHIAGVTAFGNTLTLRLTRPAPNFLARISLPFFCAVPIGTPIDPDGLRKVPSAGPYYVASHVPSEGIVLLRNPSYRGPRPHRPDAIRITVGTGQAGTLRRVQAGEVDYALYAITSSSAGRLEDRYGDGSAAAKAGRQRYFVHTSPGLDQLIFNTSRPPFSSALLRRAVNYAIDRRALARRDLFSGVPASPTDQYLPPGIPGFRDARIYPFTPDLAKARRLAGPKRRTVVLYALSEPDHVRFAEIVKANLSRIGIDVQIRALGHTHFSRIGSRNEPFDMAVAAWRADYPDPMDFLGQLDGRTIAPSGNINYAYFDDPGFNRRLDAAARLPSPARELALGRLDVHVARTSAPWAAVANQRQHDFFSARVGCQVYNPVFGIDLAALCVRGDSRE
jgi:YVTN family beta-propeller protein